MKTADGKSTFNEFVIKLMAGKTGLPLKSLLLGMHSHMVTWDKETGEVKTIEYELGGNELTHICYEEVANIDPKCFEGIKKCRK